MRFMCRQVGKFRIILTKRGGQFDPIVILEALQTEGAWRTEVAWCVGLSKVGNLSALFEQWYCAP